jgi:hypothetical protein
MRVAPDLEAYSLQPLRTSGWGRPTQVEALGKIDAEVLQKIQRSFVLYSAIV